MTRRTRMTAIGEASIIDDQSKIPENSIPNFQNDFLTKALSQISCQRHTSAVSRRHAVLTIRVETRLAPLQRLELTTIKGPLKRWRASVDHPSPRQHNMKVKN